MSDGVMFVVVVVVIVFKDVSPPCLSPLKPIFCAPLGLFSFYQLRSGYELEKTSRNALALSANIYEVMDR